MARGRFPDPGSHLRQHLLLRGDSVQVNLRKAARVGETVNMGIGQSRYHSPATDVYAPRPIPRDLLHFVPASYSHDAAILPGKRLCVRDILVHRVYARVLDDGYQL